MSNLLDLALFYFATFIMWLITHPLEFFTFFFSCVGLRLAYNIYYYGLPRLRLYNLRRKLRGL